MVKQSASQLADNLQQLLYNLGKQQKEKFHQQIRAIEDLGDARQSIDSFCINAGQVFAYSSL